MDYKELTIINPKFKIEIQMGVTNNFMLNYKSYEKIIWANPSFGGITNNNFKEWLRNQN
jgi:hypothetical protein